MVFKGKKIYGNYKTDICPFCGGNAYLRNKVGIPVCRNHKETSYPELRCICGEWLDTIYGKFGTYCKCARCGNISLEKAIFHNKNLVGERIFETQKDKRNTSNNVIQTDSTSTNSTSANSTIIATGNSCNNYNNLDECLHNRNNSSSKNNPKKEKLVSSSLSEADLKIILESEIEKEQKSLMLDPAKRKAKILGIKSWKDL